MNIAEMQTERYSIKNEMEECEAQDNWEEYDALELEWDALTERQTRAENGEPDEGDEGWDDDDEY